MGRVGKGCEAVLVMGLQPLEPAAVDRPQYRNGVDPLPASGEMLHQLLPHGLGVLIEVLIGAEFPDLQIECIGDLCLSWHQPEFRYGPEQPSADFPGFLRGGIILRLAFVEIPMAVDVLDLGSLWLLEVRDEFGPFVLLFHLHFLTLNNMM